MTSRRLLGCWELRLDFFTTRGAPGAGFVTPEWRGAEREAPPAQRAGRAEPRAEAAGRCPGEKGDQSPRPERPREFLPDRPATHVIFDPPREVAVSIKRRPEKKYSSPLPKPQARPGKGSRLAS